MAGVIEGLSVRRAEFDDANAVQEIINSDAVAQEDRFSMASGMSSVVALIERSFLSMSAIDGEGSVLGFVAISARPTPANGWAGDDEEFRKWLRWQGYLYRILYGFHMPIKKGFEDSVMDQVFRTTFTTLPEINAIRYILPDGVAKFLC